MKDLGTGLVALSFGIAVLMGTLFGISYGYQYFKVFSAEQSGKAEYAQADQNRQITIVEAQAANEAATSKALATIKIAEAEAQAEIKRAEGVAGANKIIAEGLKGNSEYLHYLWIQQLSRSNTIYVPIEAGLPILEARTK